MKLKKSILFIAVIILLTNSASASWWNGLWPFSYNNPFSIQSAQAYDKTFYEGNKTLVIQQSVTGKTLFTVQQVSISSGLTTFEEVFNITSYLASDYTFSASDIGFNWKQYKGNNNITKADFFLFKPSNYSVLVNDYGIQPILINETLYDNETGTNLTLIYWDNQTVVIGNHTEIIDNSRWLKLNNLNGKVIKSGKSYLIKTVFTKKPEKKFSIKFTPFFLGVEEEEMTWWNGSWPFSIRNPVSDGTRPYQYSLNISNATGTNNATHVFCNGNCNINFTDIRFTLDNMTELPYWIENVTTGKVWVNVTANGTVNMYYGNLGVSTTSNGTNTFIQWHGNATSQFTDAVVQPQPLIFEAKARVTSATYDVRWGTTIAGGSPYNNQGSMAIGAGSGDGQTYFIVYHGGSAIYVGSEAQPWTTNVWRRIKIISSSTEMHAYVDDNEISTGVTSSVLTDHPMGLFGMNALAEQEWSFIRKYASPEPTWATWGAAAEQQPPFMPPSPINLANSTGNFWINHTWSAGDGNVTNSYNVSVNGTWTNGSANTYKNTTGINPHGWANISVYAFNSSGGGTLNQTAVSQNTQIPNNAPVQAGIGDKNVNELQLLVFQISSTDIDGDNLTYNTNATKGTLNNTGYYSWTPTNSESGIYIWYFNTTDNYSAVATETITVTVNNIPEHTPPSPINIDNTMGLYYINHTWEPGTGNITDSYNVSINGIWTNNSINTYYNHTSLSSLDWSNISVYAYNTSSIGTLNLTPATQNIQMTYSIIPFISIANNSYSGTTLPSGIFLDSGESITLTANSTNNFNTWNWYKDGVLQANNYNNFTTSFSSGSYHYIIVNTTALDGTSNTIYWGINVFPAMAVSPGNNINLLNESPSQDLAVAIENNDMPGIVNSPIKVYTNLIGLSFYVFIWFTVFGMLWIKQKSIDIPAVIGVIFGGIIVTFLPAQYQLVSQVLIVFGIFAVIYVFFKGRG